MDKTFKSLVKEALVDLFESDEIEFELDIQFCGDFEHRDLVVKIDDEIVHRCSI